MKRDHVLITSLNPGTLNETLISRSLVPHCYALVSSTNTSHLVIASFLFDQASLLNNLSKSTINRIRRFNKSCSNSQRTNHEMSKRSQHENFIERFTKILISWYSSHDMKTTQIRIEFDIEIVHLVNRKIQINLDVRQLKSIE
jgi:plasmid replication initiation protein